MLLGRMENDKFFQTPLGGNSSTPLHNCVRTQKMAFFLCVRTQNLIYINKRVVFHQKIDEKVGGSMKKAVPLHRQKKTEGRK